ncbi:MAG: hypothetical protein GX201_08060 [Clostridiales bacterium]|nr:hypothetical protein [Clostridiales bacterium]
MKRRFIYIILILSIMMYTFGSNSVSWFISSAASGDNAFTVGTMDIGIGEGEDGSGQIDLGGLAPDRVIAQRIKIRNKGTLDCKLYGIRFNSLGSLSDIGDSLNFHIYFTKDEGNEISTSDIPVFYNYVNTILDDHVIFYPIIVEAGDEIIMVFRAELDQLQIGEEHSKAEDSILDFEILAAQIDTPLDELSERYKLLENYQSVQEALNNIWDADVLIVGANEYQCDRLTLNNKENVSIVGVGEENIPEFRYTEEKNNNKKGNPNQYFLSFNDCSGIIMRSIALGYYMDNKTYSIETNSQGPKPKKPLYIDGDFNQVNTYLNGEFEGKANPGHIEIVGRNNIIFIDGEIYKPPQS